jgi:hypothetical protein
MKPNINGVIWSAVIAMLLCAGIPSDSCEAQEQVTKGEPSSIQLEQSTNIADTGHSEVTEAERIKEARRAAQMAIQFAQMEERQRQCLNRFIESIT